MSILTLSFAVVLAASPVPADNALRRAVTQAEELAPDQAIAALEAAIAAARQRPEELHDDALPAFELLDAYALLALLQLATGDEDAANKTLDALIVVDIARRAPVRSYGPQLTDLYEARQIASQRAGMASLELECRASSGCALVLDGYRIERGKTGLHVGRHELWVSTRIGPEGEREWVHEVFEVTTETEKLVYCAPEGWVEDGRQVQAVPPPGGGLVTDGRPPLDLEVPPTARRRLPRSLAISGIVAGAGSVVVGALMLGLHKRCAHNLAPVSPYDNPGTCAETYKTNVPAAAVLVAAGSALMLPSTIILGLDEVRLRRGRVSAVVTFGFAF